MSCSMVLLSLRKENGEFEALDLVPYSSPPDLPDVMKSQETNGQEQTRAHCGRRGLAALVISSMFPYVL
ncbi:hypothetical protein EVAR_99287_1 [Eumeta japonica]|uniref:Uncharacterized protein n=1 Tax=Eumeta variegata TaxID=151549 RepID=A0A4C1T710_EUMVA|nr:hypothetical protein EVAR_99287_1 [Eumeta japonica]